MTEKPSALAILEAAKGLGQLSEFSAKDLVGLYGVATPRRVEVADVRAALEAFADLQAPVAVKIVSSSTHKSDIGGVELNVKDVAGLQAATSNIERSAARAGVELRGFLIEEMAPAGVEVLVGGVVDRTFGPAVMLGMGGIFTEVLNDATARICPVIASDVIAMVHELKAAPLLLGARGRAAVDLQALADIVLAIGGEQGLLMQHASRIREVDLNPVMLSAAGAIAVDARVILQA